MIIDSHCHLNYEPMKSDISGVLQRAKKNNVEYFLTISTDNKSFQEIINIIKDYSNIFGTYGIHPHEAKHYTDITEKIIIDNLNLSKKLIGIGETGFDFYYNHSDQESQKKVFEKHILAAQQTNKPLIIHSRAAEKETFDILNSEMKNKNFKILMHCFTGSSEFAKKLLDLNAYFSASGVITFKNSNELLDTFKSIPTDKILVETDSPYLAPVPIRGQKNEPSHIIHTVRFLANHLGLDNYNFINLTTKNFCKLFNVIL